MNSYRSIHRIGILLGTLALLLVAGVATAEEHKLSGTLTMTDTEVGLILGGESGSGTLTFEGNEYPFKVSGAKLGGTGVTKDHVTGKVYDLNNVEDFYGSYFKAEAGIAIAEGGASSWVKNEKGVILELTSTSEGLALKFGVEGFTIGK